MNIVKISEKKFNKTQFTVRSKFFNFFLFLKKIYIVVNKIYNQLKFGGEHVIN